VAERRSVQFPEQTWQEVQALPSAVRQRVEGVLFRLAVEPVPPLADPYPPEDPLPGAFMLHLPADDLTIWYVVTPYEGTEVITVLAIRPDA
jgi:hypothetical protein